MSRSWLSCCPQQQRVNNGSCGPDRASLWTTGPDRAMQSYAVKKPLYRRQVKVHPVALKKKREKQDATQSYIKRS